jgi:outer membrane protein OmpA-like peptidoglycan-associated protein
MRGGIVRRRYAEDEEESSFVSMTDMTVGFLFIVILLLAFFASQYNKAETVPRFRYKAMQDQYDAALLEIERLIVLTNNLQAQNLEKDRRAAELEALIARLESELEDFRELRENPLEAYLARSTEARRSLIEKLKEAVQQGIDKAGVKGLSVDISAQGDALRFQGEGLFLKDESILTENGLKIIRLLGDQLRQELPCFTLGEASNVTTTCNPGLSLIETVQVEGHADTDGSYQGNLILSALRAASALGEMVNSGSDQTAEILLFQNLLSEPVMAVAAYSSDRPVATNATEEGKAANRRIDLRFIMYVPPGLEFLPQTVADIPAISEKLRERAAPPVAPGPAP